MLTPSLNTVMTRLLIVAAVLATLIIFVLPATFAQADEMVKYPENGTGEVRTFTSTDPEGAGIDWDVTGVDADDFLIDERGMLMFKKSPNYESPTDRGYDANDDNDFEDADEGDFAPKDNMYHIMVRATEQTTGGSDVRALSTETDVVVEVTDRNEDGTAAMNRLQPEVYTEITARLSDVDGALDFDSVGTTLTFGTGANAKIYTLGWAWYVSKVTEPLPDVDDHWIAATGTVTPDDTDPKNSTYRPAGKRVAGAPAGEVENPNVAVDEGKYLRAVVTYLDMGKTETDYTASPRTLKESDIRTAIAVSMNPVRAEVSSDNDGDRCCQP